MIPESNIWVPDVTCYNRYQAKNFKALRFFSVGQKDVIDYEQRRVIISNDGFVVRSNPAIFNTRCTLSVGFTTLLRVTDLDGRVSL